MWCEKQTNKQAMLECLEKGTNMQKYAKFQCEVCKFETFSNSTLKFFYYTFNKEVTDFYKFRFYKLEPCKCSLGIFLKEFHEFFFNFLESTTHLHNWSRY